MNICEEKYELSVTGRKWIRKVADERSIYSIKNSFMLDEIDARLLASRDIEINEIENFIDPKIKNLLPDPFHLKDMDKAVKRTIESINNGSKIIIFADYDVDGATSSALLKRVFDKIGLDSEIYIPDRIIDGYGPSAKAMDRFKESGADLVFTLDCGALAFDALSHANEISLDVIVIDHHIGAELLPHACAIVNPNRLDEETKTCKNLAAVGVTFMFAIALISTLRKDGFFKDRAEPNLMEMLDLVAVGTVCDVMSLTGINRAIVTQGIKILNQKKNLGLKTLMEIAAIDTAVDCYHIGFVIGPRINAGGRVGKSYLGAKLLSTEDEVKAFEYAIELDNFNNERKLIEQKHLQEAILMAEEQIDNNAIIVSNDNWHLGVIGILAGRIKDRLRKPTIVINFDGDIGKASARSTKGVNIGAKIFDAKNLGLIIEGGGHAAAAGFSIHKSKLPDFIEYINGNLNLEKEKLEIENFAFYDLTITSDGLSFDLIDSINKLAPFGHGNNEPIIKISDLFVLKANIISDKHINMLLAPDRSSYGKNCIKAISFNSVGTEIETTIMSNYPHKITIYGNIRVNEWQNKSNLQFLIHDIKI